MRRRELVLAATAAALARPVAAAAADEAGILERLIAREDAAAFAHRTRSGPQSSAIAGHETAHAKALRTELAALGGRGPEPPRTVAELDEPARRLAEADRLAAPARAIALEASLLEAYDDALLALTEPSILRTAATIAASHAQHHALLRREAGLDPLA